VRVSSSTRAWSFFKRVLLDPIGADVARPRHLRRQTEPAQRLDATLRRHQAAELAGHPLGDLAPGPLAPIGRRFAQRHAQPLLLSHVQQRSRARIVVTAIAQPGDSVIVVAPHDGADPARRVAGHRRHGLGRVSLAQQPDDLKMTALNAVRRGLLTVLQRLGIKVRGQINFPGHADNMATSPSLDTPLSIMPQRSEKTFYLTVHAETV
jgi:hypothetical protein